jgi:hypothetical protein
MSLVALHRALSMGSHTPALSKGIVLIVCMKNNVLYSGYNLTFPTIKHMVIAILILPLTEKCNL